MHNRTFHAARIFSTCKPHPLENASCANCTDDLNFENVPGAFLKGFTVVGYTIEVYKATALERLHFCLCLFMSNRSYIFLILTWQWSYDDPRAVPSCPRPMRNGSLR